MPGLTWSSKTSLVRRLPFGLSAVITKRRAAVVFLRFALVLAAAVGGWPRSASAQGAWHVEGRAGGAIPIGALSDKRGPGVSLGLGAGYRVSQTFWLRLDGSFVHLVGDDVLDLGAPADADLWSYLASVEFFIDPRRPVKGDETRPAPRVSLRFYAGAGGTTMTLGGRTATRAAVAMGFGASYEASRRTSLFGRAGAQAIFTGQAFENLPFDDASVFWLVPIEVGVRVQM